MDKETKDNAKGCISTFNIILTLIAIVVGGIGIWIYFNPKQESEPVPPLPGPELLSVSEPTLGDIVRLSDLSGRREVYARVSPEVLADDARTLSFDGVEGDFYSLTLTDDRTSLVDLVELVPDDPLLDSLEVSPPLSPNLLSSRRKGKVALFRLPRTGTYRLRSSIPDTLRGSIILKAFALSAFQDRKVEPDRVVKGTIDHPGEVDIYSLDLAQTDGGIAENGRARARLFVELKVTSGSEGEAAGKLAMLRMNSEGQPRGFTPPASVNQVHGQFTDGSLIVLYPGEGSDIFDFSYTLTIRRLQGLVRFDPTGGEKDGTIEFSGDSVQYVMPVEQDSVWTVILQCDEPFTGHVFIAPPRTSAGSDSGPCSPTASRTVRVRSGGDMYLRVLGYGDTGNYRLSIKPGSLSVLDPSSTPPLPTSP